MNGSVHTSAFVFLFSLFALASSGQETGVRTHISLNLKGKTVEQIINEIGVESGLSMTFSVEDLPDRSFRKKMRNKPVTEIMDFVLSGSNLEYTIDQTRLIIYQPADKKISLQPTPERKYFTLSGYIIDSLTGESLIGSAVLASPSGKGNYSNTYGFYSLTLPDDTERIRISYLGYRDTTIDLNLRENIRMDVGLSPLKNLLPEVIVEASEYEDEDPIQSSGANLGIGTIKEVAAIFGESDVLRSIELLPGILASGEGSGSFSVRGGEVDHNLILLDEAPIYHSSHFLGIFSVFNADALHHVKLIKGDIPTEYRGRLSSIVDIHMKEGNVRKFGGKGGIGLLASRLMMEGPLFGETGSFMISGRRTYLDLIVKAISGDLFNENGLHFSDLNVKTNFKLTMNDRLYGSLYLGNDVFRFDEDAEITWGNKTATFRWNHLFSDKLFLNTSFIYSDFNFNSFTDLVNVFEDTGQTIYNTRTRVRDFNLKGTFNYYPDAENGIKFGAGVICHRFVPGRVMSNDRESEPSVDPSRKSDRYALETATFFSHQYKNSRWSIEYGMHISLFTMLGADAFVYKHDREGAVIDSTFYLKGKTIGSYFGAEPRVSASYNLGKEGYIKASYNRTYQYLQRIGSSFVNNPSSVWLPSSKRIKPQIADHFSVGYGQPLGKWTFNTELFFGLMKNQMTFRNGAKLGPSNNIESQLVFGKARAVGIEFLLQKKAGRFRGWLAYTLSRSTNKFDEINDANWYPRGNDRTHDIGIVAMYDLTPKCIVAANWVFYTGKPVTLADGKYEIDGRLIDFYSQRNGYRMLDSHRMDLSITWFKRGIKQQKGSSFNLSFYNFYAHQNPYFLYFNDDELKQISLFTFVPSFTWNFEF